MKSSTATLLSSQRVLRLGRILTLAPECARPRAQQQSHCGRQRNSRAGLTVRELLRPGTGALRGQREDAPVRLSDFGLWTLDFGLLFALVLLLSPCLCLSASASLPEALFQAGVAAYRTADYKQAADAFRQSVNLQPASGTLQDLGNAEWQQHSVGQAILAWEQALWLDPLNLSARQNLRFARKTAQLEAPELAWYEVISTWLPVSWWAWIAGGSLWLAGGMILLPGILWRRKATWHQAVAAVTLMIFLLSIPALFGVERRARLGFVLEKDTPLRLTPTAEAQAITRLAPGDPARVVRTRGRYLLIRTSRSIGWVERSQFGLTCPARQRKTG